MDIGEERRGKVGKLLIIGTMAGKGRHFLANN